MVKSRACIPATLVLKIFIIWVLEKVWGRIYQQTFIDICTRMAFVKLYDRKNARVAADFLNDRVVVPGYEEHDVRLLRMLTDRGTEYCGNRECHEYELYLAIEDIDHLKTKARSPQTNGVCERFHKTIQGEFYAVVFRKKIYRSLEKIQEDADQWIEEYNTQRTHSGKYCFGKTPYQTFVENKHLADEKILDRLQPTEIVLSERSQVSDEVVASTNFSYSYLIHLPIWRRQKEA